MSINKFRYTGTSHDFLCDFLVFAIISTVAGCGLKEDIAFLPYPSPELNLGDFPSIHSKFSCDLIVSGDAVITLRRLQGCAFTLKQFEQQVNRIFSIYTPTLPNRVDPPCTLSSVSSHMPSYDYVVRAMDSEGRNKVDFPWEVFPYDFNLSSSRPV